jgi:exodeoxyribonuclease III
MILVTWNCCRGAYLRKTALLESLNADVAVLQECARPAQESDTCLWFGENPNQGIAVIARPPFALARLPTRRAVPRFIVPVAVSGPMPFTMLAVWSKSGQKHNYVEAVVRAVRLYRELLSAGPSVVIGDFNSNTIWDKTHRADRNHSALVRLLDEIGLVSAYHAHFNEEHGAERRPTYYFHWKEQKPFHLDYCFIPKAWGKQLYRVEVAEFEAWKTHSDHRPLLVELAAGAPS